MPVSDALIRALAVTAGALATEWSRDVARTIAEDLAAYPEPAVLAALARCRREVTGRLTLAAIVERVDDGRPGPEAAWAACPRDEAETVVLTTEQQASLGVALPLLAAGDRVGARMAFLEDYRRRVADARARHAAVVWRVSLGHDPAGREGPIREALAAGRLQAADVAGFLPDGAPVDRPALPSGPAPVRDTLTASLPAQARAAVEAELAAVEAEERAAKSARTDREAARRQRLRAQAAALGVTPAAPEPEA